MNDQELEAVWTKWLAHRAKCRKELIECTAMFSPALTLSALNFPPLGEAQNAGR